MLRVISYLITIALLSGCSELQVIGQATMREFRADGMSVEAISYGYNQKLAAKEKAAGVVMAKATMPEIAVNGSVVGSEKKLKAAKTKKVRGLWEMASTRMASK